jgi:hypothetical protein
MSGKKDINPEDTKNNSKDIKSENLEEEESTTMDKGGKNGKSKKAPLKDKMKKKPKSPKSMMNTNYSVDELNEKAEASKISYSMPMPVETERSLGEEEKINNMIKEEKSKLQAKIDNSDNPINSIVNRSMFDMDYSFSMENYICDKSEVMDLTFFNYEKSPDGFHIIRMNGDPHKMKAFPTRYDFWQANEINIARIFISRIKLRAGMAKSMYSKFFAEGFELDNQYERISYDKGLELFDKSLEFRNLWAKRRHIYYYNPNLAVDGQNKVLKLPSQNLGNACIVKNRSYITYYNQTDFHTPETSPYILDCLISPKGVYDELQLFNFAGNRFVLKWKQDQITDNSMIGIRHPPNTDISTIMTRFTTMAPSIPYKILNVMQSLVRECVELHAGDTIQNTQSISNTMQSSLNIASKTNAFANTVFSTNVNDIFTTFASACSMNRMFKYSFNIDPASGLDMNTVLQCFCYLIYTPAPLIDEITVDNIKGYLWNKLMGAYLRPTNNVRNQPNNANNNIQNAPFITFPHSQIYNFDIPNQTQEGPSYTPNNAQIGGLRYLSSGYPTYRDFLQNNPPLVPEPPINAFFRFAFRRIDTNNYNSVLYEGPNRGVRYDMVRNFMSALTVYTTSNVTLSPQQRTQITYMKDVLAAQLDGYRFFTLFLTNTVNILTRLGISNFDIRTEPYEIWMDPLKMVAFTTNMSSFTCQFTSKYYEIKAWASAFKAEIAIIANVFFKYWNEDAYYSKQLLVTSSDMGKFLKPIVDLYKPFVSTRLALDIWDTIWVAMVKQGAIIDQAITRVDPLGINSTATFITATNSFEDLLTRAGYSRYCVYKGLPNTNDPFAHGLYYTLISNEPLVPIFQTTLSNYIEPPRSLIVSPPRFPCFRAKPMERKRDNETWLDTTVMNDVFDSTGIVDVPLYWRWADTTEIRQDPILTRLPTIMPVSMNPIVEIESFNDEFGPEVGVFNAIGNDKSEFVFISSKSFAGLFYVWELK